MDLKWRELEISHQQHSARQQGKSLAAMNTIRYALATNKSLILGTANVDALYERIKFEFPGAKISKGKNCVLMEKEE